MKVQGIDFSRVDYSFSPTKPIVERRYLGPLPSLVGKYVLPVVVNGHPSLIYCDKGQLNKLKEKYGVSNKKRVAVIREDYRPAEKYRKVDPFYGMSDKEREKAMADVLPEEIDYQLLHQKPEQTKKRGDTVERFEDIRTGTTESIFEDIRKSNIPSVIPKAAQVSAVPTEPVKVTPAASLWTFEAFWETYGIKKDWAKAKAHWDALSVADQSAVVDSVPDYIASLPSKMFLKSPAAYLAGESWRK